VPTEDTPVAFFVFRRPETTARVFQRIRDARPRQLFLIADGPRGGSAEDEAATKRTREVIETVDWKCEVRRNFSEENLGLRRRISTGLDWVFAQADRAIILEDDCLPDASFFRFAGELLERFKADNRIMSITGTNFHGARQFTADSYYFSRYESCWGWATWARAWQNFDVELGLWPGLHQTPLFRKAFSSRRVADFWEQIFSRLHAGEIDSWAYAWTFAHIVQNGLAVVPSTNLVSNIGFGSDGTHTLADHAPSAMMQTAPMEFPLRHPSVVMPHRGADQFHERTQLGLGPLPHRVVRSMMYRGRRLLWRWSARAGEHATTE
jgi:hypothetical protein